MNRLERNAPEGENGPFNLNMLVRIAVTGHDGIARLTAENVLNTFLPRAFLGI